MGQDDNAYFANRADAERERAERASHPKVAAVHHQLANAYRQRIPSNNRDRTEDPA